MADSSLPVGTTGEKLQTYENTVSGQEVHSEAQTPVDRTGAPFTGSNRFQTDAHILARYRIADIENGTVAYYGFVAVGGNWYVLRENKSANPNTYRYVNTGAADYPAAWTARASLVYDYLNALVWP